MAKRNCRVCLGEHSEEIHRATVSVRRWFRNEVVGRLDGLSDPAVGPETYQAWSGIETESCTDYGINRVIPIRA